MLQRCLRQLRRGKTHRRPDDRAVERHESLRIATKLVYDFAQTTAESRCILGQPASRGQNFSAGRHENTIIFANCANRTFCELREPGSGCQQVRRYRNRFWTAQCLAAQAFGVSMAARADLWGYVDANGTARIATRKLDDRYQLFLRGGTSAEAPDTAAAAATSARAAFERTPVYLRTTAHPNTDRFQALIDRHATLQQLDPALVKAIVAVESSFEPDAVSAKGAIGLMQIIPETGARYGIVGDARRTVEQKLRDPAINLGVGTRYLHDLLALFQNDIELALAAYNAGEQTVRRYENTVPPFAETREYVKRVQQFLSVYRPPPPAPARRVRVDIPGRRNALMLPGDAAQ